MMLITVLAVVAAVFVIAAGLVPTRTYIPPTNGDYDTWLTNFSTVLTANPTGYGFVASDAAAVAAAQAAWHTAYLAATNGSTRGPATVAEQNSQRAASLITVRPYATAISANAGISNDMKTAIGVTVRKVTPSPIPAPTTSPLLSVIAATPLQLTVRASDQNSPSLRTRPPGVTGLELHAQTSATPITDPTAIAYNQMATKQPIAIDFDSSDVGKQAYIVGRWVTAKGLVGPWSTIKNFTVANGN